jgi:hypothetical protein
MAGEEVAEGIEHGAALFACGDEIAAERREGCRAGSAGAKVVVVWVPGDEAKKIAARWTKAP